MKVLATQRLWLRQLSASDAPFILDLLNQPSFIENIGDRQVRTEAAAVRYIVDGPVASYSRNGFGLNLVELKDRGIPIGISGLVQRDFLPEPDIGFAFLPAYWGQGYALEAAAAVMQDAREALGLRRVVAIASMHNSPSIRLLGKLGLHYERMIDAPDPANRCGLFTAPDMQPDR
jgi:RimJ/RimL family protein N-acetyltransferase